MKPAKPFETKLDELFRLMSAGRDAFVQAGQLLIEMTAENEQTYEIIIARNPRIRVSELEMLEQFGRHPELVDVVFSDSYVASKIMRLPDQQVQQALTGFVPVAVEHDSGIVVEQKRSEELTRREVDQVFADNKIREPEEQAEVIRERKARKSAQDFRFWLHKGKITFRERATFSLGELDDLLKRLMAEQVKELEADMKKGQVN